jgi:hypothetical protein
MCTYWEESVRNYYRIEEIQHRNKKILEDREKKQPMKVQRKYKK